MLTLKIKGNPVAQGRARFARRGAFVQTYDPKKSKDYKKDIQLQVKPQLPDDFKVIDKAIVLVVTFYIQRPKSVSVKKRPLPTVKPDLSNFIKIVEDALNGIVWKDDSLIVELILEKCYAKEGKTIIYVTTKEK